MFKIQVIKKTYNPPPPQKLFTISKYFNPIYGNVL